MKFIMLVAKRSALIAILLCSATTVANAQPAIDFGLFNTGVDAAQKALSDDAVDPHYELIDPSHILGDAIVATSAGGFPIGPWLEDSHLSAWIAPSTTTNGPGDFDGSPSYFYRTTFDLTGVNLNGFTIDGQWASDNAGQDILVNGESLGFINAQFGAFSPFTLDFGFVDGLNTLDFVVNNGGNEENPDGPTGLRVEFDGNGTAAPPPPPPHPHAIGSLYPTGVDDNRVALEDDFAVDPHYRISSDPFDDEQEAITVPNDGYPIPPWLANNRGSRWISPTVDNDNANGDPGVYVYETTFNLEGKDVDNAAIVLARATDDAGPTVLLNGVEVPVAASRGFAERSWFAINSVAAREMGADFQAGENSLAFVVENGGEDLNPTGLRIDNVHARAAPEGSVPIPGLYNTGVDDDGLLLDDFEPDPHYEMTAFPDDAFDPATALGGPPSPPWAENSSASRWIGPDNSPAGEGPPGEYEFTIEFDLTDLDPTTATIMGTWSADNDGSDILLNGEPTGNAQSGSFPILSPFEISNEAGHSFLPGVNSLTFLVNNAGETNNPAGVRVEGLVAFAMQGGLIGDYNGNGILDAGDIDSLSLAVQDNSNDLRFDANSDGTVDMNDHQFWISDIAVTWVGDSDLNGEFNSGDLVAVFQQGLFETDVPAFWADGDWNGDLRFNSGDFVAAFQDGGFEKGPRAGAAGVPEPSSWFLLMLGLVALLHRRR